MHHNREIFLGFWETVLFQRFIVVVFLNVLKGKIGDCSKPLLEMIAKAARNLSQIQSLMYKIEVQKIKACHPGLALIIIIFILWALLYIF